jgi:hypothetical protein
MADWPPKKNVAFTVHFPIYDNDGDLISGAAGLDSEVSIDHGTFTDCTNEATEIATSSGVYYLALTQAEMNGDIITTITKTSTTNAKTAVNVMYTATRQLVDVAYPATSGRSMVVDANGLVDSNAVKVGPTGSGTAQTARDIGASVLISSGSGTGQLDVTSGVIKANLVQILATALTETATYLAAGFKKFFNVQTPVLTVASVDQTGDSYARLGAPAGASVSADVLAVKTDTAAILLDTGTDGVLIADSAISEDTFAADALTAAVLAADAANAIADAILSRDIDQVEATAALDSLCTAILKAVSKVKDNAGTLEVYRTNGSTLHMSQTITTDAALDAISELAVGV